MPTDLDDDVGDWVRLAAIAGVGPATARALLSTFGLPGAVFDATREQLLRVVSSGVAAALQAPPPGELTALIARTVAWTHEPGNHVVTLADRRYPSLLLEITDPPPLLYVKGDVGLLQRPTLAIVGSRNATAQGAVDAKRFAQALAAAGHTIVSGLALGIDAAAHEGALAAGERGGSTIAVVGTGADLVYPSAHRELAHRVVERGVLVSEFALGTAANAHHFPRRNRVIAGLARGVLVMEAAARSGSLITARLAVECGRDVFAVPGSIHSPLSKGCHQLIRQGAKLVDSVDDILDEFPAGTGTAAVSESVPTHEVPAGAGDSIAALIGFDPVGIDDLAERCGQSPQQLAAVLLDLELAGRLTRLPGGRVQRLVA